MSPAVQAPAHPAAALAAFAEPLVRGRRVAILGSATLPLGAALTERGARLVHVYDPDPGRVAEALARRGSGSGPVVAELSDDLGIRDGAFDVVVVPDMAILGDATALVRRVQRLVSPSGVAVFASPNPEAERFLLPPSPGLEAALGYYELYDVVSLHFSEVRMLGQAPFAGYSIVDFSEDDPAVAVDTSVLDEPETPEWYVAIASERHVEVEAYSIVEIPLADVSRASPIEPVTMPYRDPPTPRTRKEEHTVPLASPSQAADRERDILALAEAQTRLAVIANENEKLRERAAELAAVERQVSHASMRVAELERELETARSKVMELEAVAARAESRAEAAEAEGLRLRAELETVRADLEAARDEPATPRREQASAAERAISARLREDLAASASRIQELERQISALEPPTLRSKEEHARQLAELRASLEASEQRSRSLHAQLAEALAERQRLEAALAEASATTETAVQAAEQAVAADVARLEAQLRERGHEIVRLQRESREAERVGKELLLELEALRVIPPHFSPEGANGAGAAGAGGGGTGLSDPGARAGGLDASALEATAAIEARAIEVAERAARMEADLVTASWRIAQLEREAAERGALPPGDASARERELERALVIAQREIAELRAPIQQT